MLNQLADGTRGDQTRRRLLEATITAVRTVGLGRLSARAVAGIAGVNQALIFYHFGSMDELLAESCRQATAGRVALWVGELEQVSDLPSLVALARRLHAREAEEGNVTVLAQALAASQTDPALARIVGESLQLWLEPITATAEKILSGTVLEGVLSPGDVARTVAAAFVGLELFEGVVPDRGLDALDALERLAVVGALALDAGPVTKSALRRRLRTAAGGGRRRRGAAQA